MGILNKLFGLKKDVSVKSIELLDWLEETSKESLEKINREIKHEISKINELKKELHEKLDGLDKEELMNKNISEREKHIMLGNRSNYVSKTKQFLTEFEIPESDYNRIDSVCISFNNRVSDFNETTGKGYFILKQFFDKEMVGIAGNLKAIEDSMVKISKKVKGEDIREYKSLSARIKEYNELSIEKEKLTKDIAEMEIEEKSSKRKKTEIEDKIQALKSSKSFSKHHELESAKNKLNQDISKLEFTLNNALKGIDKLLKAYVHDTKDKKIEAYLEKPLSSLKEDKTLHILKVVEKLKKDAKKKDQPKINVLTKEFFEDILKKQLSLSAELDQVESAISGLTIMMDYKELQYQLDHVDEKLNKITEELEDKKTLLNALELDKKKTKLEKLLSEFTGHNVAIEE